MYLGEINVVNLKHQHSNSCTVHMNRYLHIWKCVYLISGIYLISCLFEKKVRDGMELTFSCMPGNGYSAELPHVYFFLLDKIYVYLFWKLKEEISTPHHYNVTRKKQQEQQLISLLSHSRCVVTVNRAEGSVGSLLKCSPSSDVPLMWTVKLEHLQRWHQELWPPFVI